MVQYLQKIVLDVLGAAGIFPTASTDKSVLETLIRKLHPVNGHAPLIRLGPPGDGGYLLPDDLEGIEACFSPGVNLISGFEKECAQKGMKVFLADKSVEGPAEQHELFSFTRKYVGSWTDEDFMTLDDWVEQSLPGSTSDLILQIDIEGFEYETFLRMSDRLQERFRIIVVEFHSMQYLWSRPFFRIASRAFEKLLRTHGCVHIHPNNDEPMVRRGRIEIPQYMEFTFHRKDRLPAKTTFASAFPHPLDGENTGKESMVLPRCWHA